MFKKVQEETLEHLDGQVMMFEHESGLKHVHLNSKIKEFGFLLTVPTLPKNGDGRAHILEHLVLCGSEKYDVRDPFMSMLNRSCAVYMNAQTGPEQTIYPFATTIEKDFYNLMDVYLDAVFFPNLNKFDFMQEGWRYEFDEKDNLKYGGVVFNEMKGMRDENRIHYLNNATQIYNGPNAVEFGGDPLEIPNLSYEALVEFHRQHYNPKNAVIYTAGALDLNQLHEKLEPVVQKAALRKAAVLEEIEPKIFKQEKTVEIAYPNKEGKYSVSLILNDEIKSKDDLIKSIFAKFYLEKEGSEWVNFSDKIDLGIFSQRIDIGKNQWSWQMMIDGVNKKDVARAKKALKEYLTLALNAPLNTGVMESVLDQFEYSLLEINKGSMSLSLGALKGFANLMNYGINDLEDFNPVKRINKLRAWAFSGNNLVDFIKNKKECKLLEIINVPDEQYLEKLATQEDIALKNKQKSLTPKDVQSLKEELKKFKEHQQKGNNAAVLPLLTKEDVVVQSKDGNAIDFIRKIEHPSVMGIKKNWEIYSLKVEIHQPTVNVVPTEEDYWQALGVMLLDQMPTENKTVEELTEERSKYFVASTVSLQHYEIENVFERNKESKKRLDVYKVAFSFKGLTRKADDSMLNLIKESINNIKFDKFWVAQQFNQIQEFLSKTLNQRAPEIMNQLLVPNAVGRMANMLQADHGFALFMERVYEQFAQNPEKVVARLQEGVEKMLQGKGLITFIGNEKIENLAHSLSKKMPQLGLEAPQVGVVVEEKPLVFEQSCFVSNSAVNYNYMALELDFEPNSEKMIAYLIGAHLLNEKFLHPLIREQGGAYGSNASLKKSAGVLVLSSYRDPEIGKTFAAFESGLKSMAENKLSDECIWEAKLGLLSKLTVPIGLMQETNSSIEKFMKKIDEQHESKMAKLIIDCPKKLIEKVYQQLFEDFKSGKVTVNKKSLIDVNRLNDSELSNFDIINPEVLKPKKLKI